MRCKVVSTAVCQRGDYYTMLADQFHSTEALEFASTVVLSINRKATARVLGPMGGEPTYSCRRQPASRSEYDNLLDRLISFLGGRD